MTDTLWKQCERRVCTYLGGSRRGPTGRAESDCVGVPGLAISVKRSQRGVPLGRWLLQARAFGKKERAEWALVVVKPNQNIEDAVVCVRLGYLAKLRGTPFD